MEFAWTDEQQRFRQEIREALKEDLSPDWRWISRHGFAAPDQINYSREFCPKLAARGLLVRSWPKTYGGGDGTPWEHCILGEEMAALGEPRGPQYMNVNWIGPTIIRYGSPEQQAVHLGRMAQGTVIWCQGFSEPGGGSDLAAMRTKAERKGDGFVINGQKIWTSYSYMADWCFLLARTGPGRREISCFLIPMSTPGITVRPIPGIAEYGHLNEVFLDNVEAPPEALLGEFGAGWEVVTYALNYERVGMPRYENCQTVLDYCVEKLKAEGRWDDPIVQREAGLCLAEIEATRLAAYAILDQRARDLPPAADSSFPRMSTIDVGQVMVNFIQTYFPSALADDLLLEPFYRSNMAGLGAGSNEIQHDIIATRWLGLPREKA
jgi:alkylation response protein AidB-like acyl-CoA dehydrogenase